MEKIDLTTEDTNQTVQVQAVVTELEAQRNYFSARSVAFAAESAAKSEVIGQLHDRIKELESIEATLRDQIATRAEKAE